MSSLYSPSYFESRVNYVAPLTVCAPNGLRHEVIAAKRIDSFHVLVVREWKPGKEWVVHTFSEQDGGFHNGHYCESLTRAMEVFDADKRPLNRTIAQMHADEVTRRGGTVRDRVARTFAMTQG